MVREKLNFHFTEHPGSPFLEKTGNKLLSSENGA